MAVEPAVGVNLATPPAWYPDWARQLAEQYFSGATCLFILHGNVYDLFRAPSENGDTYSNLAEFLAAQVFGSWDIVLHHDLGRGLRPLAGANPARLQSMVQQLSGRLGEMNTWPREAEPILGLLDRFVERSLLDESAAGRKRIAVLFDYAQYLVPAGDQTSMARGDAARLVRMLGWAQNPYIKRVNIAFCLIVEKLTELNDRLVQNPHVAAIEIPLPDQAERERFAGWALAGGKQLAPSASAGPAAQAVATAQVAAQPAATGAAQAASDATAAPLPPERLAELSAGLSLVSLNVLISQGRQSGRAADPQRFREVKKTLIERQCQGLVEFIEPHHKLEMVVGHQAGQQRLREDADWISRGRLDAAPMGYLINGPVGTGKTFLAECYAGSIGIPCVKLRNFRSKYVGETEGNLEQVLNVLRSLGPVVVIIDEADAALGNRQSSGDSGTSSRVFSMIASQMGDTRYRGKIVWMLLTSRPDLLPIDLKRQGRAEVHIPLFYPHDAAEIVAMFTAMARKNKIALPAEALPEVSPERNLSGADIESVVLSAKRRAMTDGRTELTRADLDLSLAEFIPSAQGLEKELQEIAAVLECTQQSFLTPDWRTKMAQPGGRTRLQERMVAIRQLLEE